MSEYPPSPQPLSEEDERLWAMLAHLSVLLNLVTGFLGVFAPLIIYFLYKDRSRFVAFQAMQAFIFQLVFWGGAGVMVGVMWAVVGVLSAIFIGLICIPFAILFSFLPLGAIVYGVIGAIQTYQGQDFRYWLVADWVNL
ncbi:MAG: DUF4870 domain-containing protein [Anaerolineales bacterium]|nr:DUF4870 domain-containing protein [Anaerolineales bacterium]